MREVRGHAGGLFALRASAERRFEGRGGDLAAGEAEDVAMGAEPLEGPREIRLLGQTGGSARRGRR